MKFVRNIVSGIIVDYSGLVIDSFELLLFNMHSRHLLKRLWKERDHMRLIQLIHYYSIKIYLLRFIPHRSNCESCKSKSSSLWVIVKVDKPLSLVILTYQQSWVWLSWYVLKLRWYNEIRFGILTTYLKFFKDYEQHSIP